MNSLMSDKVSLAARKFILRIGHGSFEPQANHENILEMELCWDTVSKRTKAGSFWRDSSPTTNMTWTSMGTTNCCLCRKAESTLRNFGNLLTSTAWRRKEVGDGSCA